MTEPPPYKLPLARYKSLMVMVDGFRAACYNAEQEVQDPRVKVYLEGPQAAAKGCLSALQDKMYEDYPETRSSHE